MKILTISILIFLGLAYFHNVRADYIPVFTQDDDSNELSLGTPETYSGLSIPTGTMVKAISIQLSAPSGMGAGCSATTTNGVRISVGGAENSSYISFQTLNLTSSPSFHIFEFATAFDITDYTTFTIQDSFPVGCTPFVIKTYGLTTPDRVAYFSLLTESHGNLFFANPPHVDYAITQDFDNFRFCYNPETTAFDEVEFKMQYGSTLSQYEDIYEPIAAWGNYENCFTFPKANDLTTGDKVARVVAYFDGTPLANSDIIHFQVTTGDKTFYPIVTGTTDPVSENPQEETCLYPFPIGSLCRLVIPTYGIGEVIEANDAIIKEQLYNQVPFAYFEQINETIEGIETTPSDPTVTFAFPSAFGEETGEIEIDILDPENPLLEKLATISPWIITGLWLSFAGYLFFRIFSLFRAV